MRQITFVLCFIILVACSKGTSKISGLFTENNPVPGRSQLNFIGNNLVIKSEKSGSFKDTFRFSISTSKIILTPNWTNQYSGHSFDFKKIDDNTFKIENLYPSIPEGPKSFMTFKK